jgi:chromosome segregation ATPase
MASPPRARPPGPPLVLQSPVLGRISVDSHRDAVPPPPGLPPAIGATEGDGEVAAALAQVDAAARMDAIVERLQSEKSALLDYITETRAALGALESAKAGVDTEVAQLTSELAAATASAARLRDEGAARSEEVASLTAQLQASQGDAASARASLDAAVDRAAELSTKLEAADADRSELKEVQAELLATIREHQATLKDSVRAASCCAAAMRGV